MHLTPGTRLGPYEIVAPLGSGGMGEVYRALDTRLGRDVAIKVLPAGLSSDPDLRARFEREARTVSGLNHPHICVLHDVGREGDVDYLVMELVEGETLAHRLAKGALPPSEVTRLGAQIADALDRAHRAGVVHRDLKPGNVMLTKSGAKLMDFGLARATGLAPAGGVSGSLATGLTQSPTIAQPLTAEGTIIGTFQYMAPEQLEGKDADARADIWALGCVLYEMATGRRAFEGRSQASLIAAILERQPEPVSAIAPRTPAPLGIVINRCLAKDPDDRFQSARDLMHELRAISESSASGVHVAPASVASPRGRSGVVAWAVAGSLAVASLALGLQLLRANRTEHDVLRATLSLPPDVTLAITGDDSGPPALSPDGRILVFGANGGGGARRLWARSLDDLVARPLPGTDGGSYPFWSPDGQSIGFFSRGQLKRLDLAGGSVLALCDASNGRGGSWSRDGVIVFSPDWISALMRVPASGGQARPVTALDSTNATTHRWPEFMPDGKHFIYLAAKHDDPQASSGLWFASLDGGTPRRLMDSPSNAVFASGQLLFVRDSTLLAQRFDPGAGRLVGSPRPTREVVQFDPTTWRAMMTASANGTLVYGAGGGAGAFRVALFDRAGNRLGAIGPPANHFAVSLSPEGRRAVVETQFTPNADLWIYDLASGAGTRIAASPEDDSQPIWSPNGMEIAFATRRNGRFYRVDAARADGSGSPRTLVEDPQEDVWALQWLDGGSSLLLGRGTFQSNDADVLWWQPLDGRAARLLVPASIGCANAQRSADGRWLAFDSRVSGRFEVYVIPMPRSSGATDSPESSAPGGRWQLSAEGGSEPRWSRDGRELYYRRPDDTIVAVAVDGHGDTFRLLSERPLFRAIQRGLVPTYDVAGDGSRFLVNTAYTERQAPLVVVTHWPMLVRGAR